MKHETAVLLNIVKFVSHLNYDSFAGVVCRLQLAGDWRCFFALVLRLITGRLVCTKCFSMCTVKVTQENAARVRSEMLSLSRLL